MQNIRTLLLVVLTILVFWFVKFGLAFPNGNLETVGVILTVSSILFGFLAGFFISQLWTRYASIRELQSMRSSAGLNMIRYASHFFSSKRFQQDFKTRVEKAAVIDEILEWDETHIEIPLFRDIETSFKHIRIKNMKEQEYFGNLIDAYNQLIETTVKEDTLGKERLLPSQWFMIIVLSVIMIFSLLFVDIIEPLYRIILFVFPIIMTMALLTMYDLDTLRWSKEAVSLEPNERLFDAIGRQRFYLKKKKTYISPYIRHYRTEDNLTGELKRIYREVLENRKQPTT
jgi:hypothetical protein